MVHKLDTLMIYIQPNQLIQAIHTSNLTKFKSLSDDVVSQKV